MPDAEKVRQAVKDMKDCVLLLHLEVPPEVMMDVRRRWNNLVSALREYDETLAPE